MALLIFFSKPIYYKFENFELPGFIILRYKINLVEFRNLKQNIFLAIFRSFFVSYYPFIFLLVGIDRK